jgi:hypothetical protein
MTFETSLLVLFVEILGKQNLEIRFDQWDEIALLLYSLQTQDFLVFDEKSDPFS